MMHSRILRLLSYRTVPLMKSRSSSLLINSSTITGIGINNRVTEHNLRFYFRSCCLQLSEEISNHLAPETDEFEQDEYKYPKEIDIAKITQGVPEIERKLKLLLLEVDVLRQQGNLVPDEISTENFLVLLHELPLEYERIKYLRFLRLIEIKVKSKKEKQIVMKKYYEEEKKIFTEARKNLKITTAGPVIYGLMMNSLFLRIYDQHINMFQNYRLTMAEAYGPVLLIDCSYEPFMNHKNRMNCVKQLLLAWSSNRENFKPFHIVFCNMNEDSKVLQKLNTSIQFLNDLSIPFYYTPKSYSDLFPKNKLVYLTPDARDELQEYRSDNIYIIGAFVDNCQSSPVSLSKCKKENLSMAKFPLDKYLKWDKGRKSLTINQCVDIMNDIKDTGDWLHAFRHVPKRKTVYVNNDRLDVQHMSYLVTKDRFRQNLMYDLLLKQNSKQKSSNNDAE